MISSREPLSTEPGSGFSLWVHGPEAGEQMDLWHAAVDGSGTISGHHIETLVSQFSMSTRTIRHIGNVYRSVCDHEETPADTGAGPSYGILWDACREQTRTRLSDLAQTIRPATPHLMPERLVVAPTPTMAPVIVCVVETGIPI